MSYLIQCNWYLGSTGSKLGWARMERRERQLEILIVCLFCFVLFLVILVIVINKIFKFRNESGLFSSFVMLKCYVRENKNNRKNNNEGNKPCVSSSLHFNNILVRTQVEEAWISSIPTMIRSSYGTICDLYPKKMEKYFLSNQVFLRSFLLIIFLQQGDLTRQSSWRF